MDKKILKTLNENLDIDEDSLSKISSNTVLFGPMSETGFDSIDAMSYISALRKDYKIPVSVNIGLDQIITISDTEKWLSKNHYM